MTEYELIALSFTAISLSISLATFILYRRTQKMHLTEKEQEKRHAEIEKAVMETLARMKFDKGV